MKPVGSRQRSKVCSVPVAALPGERPAEDVGLRAEPLPLRMKAQQAVVSSCLLFRYDVSTVRRAGFDHVLRGHLIRVVVGFFSVPISRLRHKVMCILAQPLGVERRASSCVSCPSSRQGPKGRCCCRPECQCPLES